MHVNSVYRNHIWAIYKVCMQWRGSENFAYTYIFDLYMYIATILFAYRGGVTFCILVEDPFPPLVLLQNC
jgi:hypothetical protein